MKVRTATEILDTLQHLRDAGHDHVAPMVLWDELKALNSAGYFTGDVDPTLEKLTVLRALPLAGLNEEHVMVALVLTEDSTPEIAAERKRLSKHVMSALAAKAGVVSVTFAQVRR